MANHCEKIVPPKCEVVDKTERKRKLVGFPNCWDKGCRPGKKWQCNGCRMKCQEYPCQQRTMCKCPEKFECVCDVAAEDEDPCCALRRKMAKSGCNHGGCKSCQKNCPLDEGKSEFDSARDTLLQLCVTVNQQLKQLKKDIIPFIEKRELFKEYKAVGDQLNKILKELMLIGNGGKFDLPSLLHMKRDEEVRFVEIKSKHDRLVERFKNHKKSFLYYLSHYSSYCFPFR